MDQERINKAKGDLQRMQDITDSFRVAREVADFLDAAYPEMLDMENKKAALTKEIEALEKRKVTKLKENQVVDQEVADYRAKAEIEINKINAAIAASNHQFEGAQRELAAFREETAKEIGDLEKEKGDKQKAIDALNKEQQRILNKFSPAA